MGAILSFGIKRGKTVKNEKLSKNTFFLDRIDRFCVRKIDTITVDRKDRKIEFPTLMKTEPDAVGAYSIQQNTSAWLQGQIHANRSQTFTFASAPAATGSVFMPRFRLFLGQCNVAGTKNAVNVFPRL